MMYPYWALINLIGIYIYVFIRTYSPLKASGIDDVLWVLAWVSFLCFSICIYQVDTLKKIEEIKAKLEKDKK